MSYSLAYSQAIAVLISIGAKMRFQGAEWVSASAISEALGIPRPTVTSILSRLLASGIIESKEGKQGGVRLLKAPEAISLLHVFDAIERKRPLFRGDLALGKRTPEILAAGKKVMGSFAKAEKLMRGSLAEVRLSDLFGCK
jgi:Rrf2 family protein